MTLSSTLRDQAVGLWVLLALAPAPSLAQKLSFGPMAGVAMSTWRGADVRDALDFRTGLAGGGFVRIGLYKAFGLETQVLYAIKGMQLATATCSSPNTCQPLHVSWTQHYVEIPLLVTATVPTRFGPSVFVGPAVARLTSCTFQSSQPPSPEPCDSVWSGNPGSGGAQPPTPSMKHTDALLVFGGEFHLGPFGLQARYDLGLTKFVVFQGRSLDYKTRAWIISAGYQLPRGKR